MSLFNRRERSRVAPSDMWHLLQVLEKRAEADAALARALADWRIQEFGWTDSNWKDAYVHLSGIARVHDIA